ncbi:MAG TPA: endonuclease III [Candidatus Thermoplasmatota archaeon]|nr:endonuclease III [Candidatus Thermoplasmatota archaeon]
MRETKALRAKRGQAVFERLSREYPEAHCALDYTTPLDLLVATMLSAQCTDAMVNKITPTLFARCKTARDYLDIPREELEKIIFRSGFYRNKAKNIQGMAAALLERHAGEVPRTMEELVALPGVARKTANVVLGNAFGIVEGVCVDTHVGRLSRRLGLSPKEDPEKVEQDLMDLFPREQWFLLTYYLIEHGRAVCDAKKPECAACVVADLCPKRGVPRPKVVDD